MKKVYLLLLLGSSFSLICQTIIYEQDFSNGIPSTWTTSGTSQGVSNSVIGFYYRGPNTTPNNTIGSNGFVASSGPIGLLSSNQDPILSLTPGNGFIIIDPEAYVGGFYWFMSQWMFATGPAPTPHTGILETEYLNFACHQDSIELRFNQYYRHYSGQTFLDISLDKGLTWQVNQLNNNMSSHTQTSKSSIVSINIGSIVSGNDSVKFRFRYSDFGNNGGWGGYFWMIDDLKIIDLDSTFIPSNYVLCDVDSIEISGPLNNDNYLWNTGDTASSIFINQGGTYTLITGNQYCSDSLVYNVIESSTPLIQTTFSGALGFCQGDTLDVLATGASSYSWSNGSSLDNQNFSTNGSYYVTGFDSTGYCSDTSFFNVIVSPNIAIVTDSFICDADSTLLSANGGDSYLWSTGDTASSIIINQGGTYSLIASNQYCSDTIVFNITESSTPSIQTTFSGPLTFCQGDTLDVLATGASSYSWSNGSSLDNQNFSTNGSYYVAGFDSTGYCSDTSFFNVIVNSNPNIIITGDSFICDGDSTILSASGANSYLWVTGNTNSFIWVDSSGIYSVEGVGSDGCTSIVSKQITVFPKVNGTEINGDIIVTPYSVQTYTTNLNPNNSYNWTITGGLITSGQGSNSISVLWRAGPIGYLNVLEANSGCSNSDSIIVYIYGVGLVDNSLNSIILSPNPNSGLFNIQVDQEHIGSSYQVLDNLGRLIDKGIIRELSQDFDLSDKPKGVYRIQVSNEKSLKTLNVVIQ